MCECEAREDGLEAPLREFPLSKPSIGLATANCGRLPFAGRALTFIRRPAWRAREGGHDDYRSGTCDDGDRRAIVGGVLGAAIVEQC